MKIVKKGLLVLLSLTFIGGAMFNIVGCKGNDNNSSTSSSNASHEIASSPEDVEDNTEELSIPELVGQQAHEEKPGYKFCGYFEDENFTKRVTKTFDKIPEGYYAKYQPDKTQMMEYTRTGDDSLYTPMTFEQTIYGETLIEVREKYLQMVNYHFDIRNDTVSAKTTYEWIYGNQFDTIDMFLNDVPKNQILEFEDKCAFPIPVMAEDGMSVKRVFLHYDIKWNAYFGDPETTEDGIRYYIVENKYAVVVGFDGEKTPEVLSIPSTLEGKPVQEMNVFVDGEEWTIKELTVPSSVKNAMLYYRDHPLINDFVLEKLTFEEGVQTIRVISKQTEEIYIPSTAYFVDLVKISSVNSDSKESIYFTPDQKITVNGGEHYYTENGLLYSTEGDLVHQFGNRQKLDLQLNNQVKRVLYGSVNGLARVIKIPENVEYFDVRFNIGSLRYRQTKWAGSWELNRYAPIFVMNSEKVLGQWLRLAQRIEEDSFAIIDNGILLAYRYIIKGSEVDVEKVLNSCGASFSEEEKEEVRLSFSKEEKTENGKKIVEYIHMSMRIVNDDEIYLARFDGDTDQLVWMDTPSAYLNSYGVTEALRETDGVVNYYYEYINRDSE